MKTAVAQAFLLTAVASKMGWVLSLGSVVMAPEAEVGEILSDGRLFVGERINVLGTVALAGDAVGASAAGLKVRRRPLDAPSLDALSRQFSGAGGAALVLSPGANETLAPGSYGATTLDGDVTFVAGPYSFSTLTIRDSARVRIEGSDGPAIVRVAGDVEVAGNVQAEEGALLLELDGIGTANLRTSITATVVAAEGAVRIHEGIAFRGTVYADRISVEQDATVLHLPPVLPQ